MTPSSTQLVILPSYNTGARLREVVAEALRHWQPVWVVVDGSTDGSDRVMVALAENEPQLKVFTLPCNRGKGAVVLAGAQAARERGFTHALVMDADGQHPAESIEKFMEVSRLRPDAMVLGRLIFPANIPTERLYGRKLSVGLVRFELLGAGIADPLFGFRIYPLVSLLAVFDSCRGGRHYDFDTEAAVRLGWAGVRPVNVDAPVRYFSRAEGGVSHFHYLRDNATLVWMHTRLITELLLRRWPALLGHRRRWRSIGFLPAVLLLCAVAGQAAAPDPLVNPEHKLVPAASEWSSLIDVFAHQPDTLADFTERRFFPFKKDAVELKGEVRVSTARGLSLHYTMPEERIVILDEKGILLRAAAGEKAPPVDPRATATNEALLHILRFDFGALEKDFELYGQRDDKTWTLALMPRSETLRRTIGRISVAGLGATISRIELRRSAKQAIEILMEPPRPPATFTAEELKRYFR